MSTSISEIVSAQYLGTSTTTLYTSPTGVTTRIDKLSICNVGLSAAQVTLFLVPSGSSASGSNTTTNAQTILTGQTFNSPNEYGHYLNPGDSLAAFASAASSLTIAVGGTQVTS